MNIHEGSNEPERLIFESALRFGTWLMAQTEITEDQRAALVKARDAIANLPALPEVYLDFGCRIIHGDFEGRTDEVSTSRGWDVSLPMKSSPCRELSIYSTYCTWPLRNMWDDFHLEHSMIWTVEKGLRVEYGTAEGWCREIDQLDLIREGCSRFEIEVSVANVTFW